MRFSVSRSLRPAYVAPWLAALPVASLAVASLAVAFLAVAHRAGAQSPRLVNENDAQYRAAPTLSLVAERRWCAEADAAGCDMRSMFSLVALPDGGIVAADIPGPIHRFGADGRFVGALGRKGKGPGEYGFVVDPALQANGELAWFDNTAMRVTRIDLAGKPGRVTNQLLPPSTMDLFITNGALVVLDVPASARVGDSVTASYRMYRENAAERTLATVRTAAVFVTGSEMRAVPGPFRAHIVADVGIAGDIAHSNSSSYAFDVFPAIGTPWRLRISIPPRPVTAADRDSVITGVLERLKVANVASLPPLVREEYQNIPATYPAVSAVRVLRDGTVWIRPTPAPRARTARWDVFSRDGRRLGQAALPISAQLRDGDAGWILVTELGDDDVPQAVRYRVGAKTSGAR